MELSNFLLFLSASILLIISPGPDSLYVSVRSLTQGVKSGVIAGAGVALGTLMHTLAVILGLAALLQTSAFAFSLVKYVGALYLIWMGIGVFRTQKNKKVSKSTKILGTKTLFFQGFITNVLNPKVALFFLSFLPQFTIVGEPLVPQLLRMGTLFCLLTMAWLSLLAWLMVRSKIWLGLKEKGGKGMQYLTGIVLIGLGVRLALAKQ